MVLYLLDLFGVAVFAVSGALAAGRKGMDVFGVIVIAVVTAVGGGTIRDVLLDRPILWINDPTYLYVIIAAAGSILVYTRFRRPPRNSLLIADAFGLAVFTALGAQSAELAGVPDVIVVIMGAITGAAGGVLRDVLCAEIPLILRREIYATASIAGASMYVLLNGLNVVDTVVVPASIGIVFALRLAAIRWNLNVPSVALENKESE